MTDSEWEGEPHKIVVTKADPPCGRFDDWHLEYEIEHPPSCKSEEVELYDGHVTETQYDCQLDWEIREGDLAFALQYSGTPITAPSEYKIRSWGRKIYCWEYWAYEYDSGVVVIDEEAES